MCSLDLDKYSFAGDSFAIGANAQYGWNSYNPRAYFDNLIITDSGESSNIFPMKEKNDSYSLINLKLDELHKLYTSNIFDIYLLLSNRFIKYCPDFDKIPDLLFNNIIALRKTSKWEEARKVASSIIKKYPNSKYAKMMGGIDGRTEDQAAFRFAEINKLYAQNNFEECINQIKLFQTNFPNNWRRKDSLFKMCYCYYHLKNDNDFLNYAKNYLAEFYNEQDSQNICILIISFYIQKCNQTEARKSINEFRIRYQNSHYKDTIDQLEIESYFYKENINITLSEWNNIERQEEFQKIEEDLYYYTKKWIIDNKLMWFSKNLGFILHLYEETNRREKSLEIIEEIFVNTKNYAEARKRFYTKVYTYLEFVGEFDKLINITKEFINLETDENEKKKLENFLLQIDGAKKSSIGKETLYKNLDNQ